MKFSDDFEDRVGKIVADYLRSVDEGGDSADLDAVVAAAPPEYRDEIRLRCTEGQLVRGFFDDHEPAPGTLQIGDCVDDFEILSLIAHGAMGTVYRARRLSQDQIVALKLIHEAYGPLPDFRARFRQEAEALAAVEHPGIVSIVKAGEHEGRPFIAMRFVTGDTLDRHFELAAEGSIDDPWDHERESTRCREIVESVISILKALEVLHAKGITHRDIKPENVLMGEDGQCVIVDFGLAHAKDARRQTRAGEMVGSLPYLSLEDHRGYRDEFPVSRDLWAVGVTLYELLTRRLPFVAVTQQAMARLIETQDPPDCRRYNRDVSADLALIVNKALRKNMDLRYRSAAEFATDLESAVAGLRPSEARKTSHRVLSHVDRRRDLYATIAVVMLLILGSVLAHYVFDLF